MISALFVETGGVYFGLDNIDPWDINRDAKKCRSGALAICHPPCERWGRYWGGGPSVKVKRLLGDDNQCFAFSLWYVRTFGGVIEHPEASHAWKYYGLTKPPKKGGWIKADEYGGLTCCVEQGNYGHPARKATWLYINKIKPIELVWGKAEGKVRIEEGFNTKAKADKARAQDDYIPVKRISAKERVDTPTPFRDMLIDLANRR